MGEVCRRWERCLEAEGPALGLEGCRPFLENKYINDVFFEGTCRGRACVVKCSSKCPWSIGNEYRLGRRVFEAAPEVVAEPLAWHESPAFVAVEKVGGPSLTELLARGVADAQADGFAADVLRLVRALRETGVVHRDVFSDNLILGADGHLKLIDFQLAVDRADYREDPWVVRNWKFRYVVFGVNRDLGLGVWNDVRAFRAVLAQLPQTAAVAAADAELARGEDAAAFACPPDRLTAFKLRLYAVSLRFQMLLNRNRPEKFARLERRWRTIEKV